MSEPNNMNELARIEPRDRMVAKRVILNRRTASGLFKYKG